MRSMKKRFCEWLIFENLLKIIDYCASDWMKKHQQNREHQINQTITIHQNITTYRDVLEKRINDAELKADAFVELLKEAHQRLENMDKHYLGEEYTSFMREFLSFKERINELYHYVFAKNIKE